VALPPALVTLTDCVTGLHVRVMVPEAVKSPSVLKVTAGVLPGKAVTVMETWRPLVSPAGTGSSQLGLTWSENVSAAL
jgi:hypothetical protein